MGMIVVQVTNAAVLRRRCGRAWAERLGDRLAPMLAAMVRPERVVVAGQDRVELDLVHGGEVGVDEALRAITTAFARPVTIGGAAVAVELAIGVALTTASGTNETCLIEEAEEACAQARHSGAPIIRRVGVPRAASAPDDLSADLGRGIDNDELLLLYQPKVHLRRRTVASLEALVRWRHPVRGMILPADFIPLAEESGEIAALTLWVLRRATADGRMLAAMGYGLPIYVNVSGVLLTDEAFIREASALVTEANVSIGFEITETSVIRDPAAAIGNLNRFAAIGIPIAIDDYGAGLSSLAYLKQLPACELKIDKLFVTQLTSSHRDPLIVRSTIDLAHALEMEVVAEGIESATALALLTVMGCDLGQGYFISHPLDLGRLAAFLGRHRDGWTQDELPSPLARLRAATRQG